MKNFLVILFALSHALNLNSQIYYPFPDSNTVWNVGLTPPTTKIFAIKGDSMYNALTYKKYFTVNDTNLSIAQFTFFAIVRQDLPNKKIYGIKNGDLSEKLIYNFNLNVNDTSSVHPFDFGNGQTYYIKVISKDSVIINSQYRKRIKVDYWSPFLSSWSNPEYWIEGIGSTFGIFNSGVSGYQITDVCFPSLMCQKQNGVLNYVNPTCVTCFDDVCQGVGIKEIEIAENSITTYPIPAKDELNVSFNLDIDNEFTTIEILNNLGQIIREEEIFFKNKRALIKTNALPNGVYLLNLKSSNSLIVSKRFVVAR